MSEVIINLTEKREAAIVKEKGDTGYCQKYINQYADYLIERQNAKSFKKKVDQIMSLPEAELDVIIAAIPSKE